MAWTRHRLADALSPASLRWWLLGFFIAVAVPAGVLVWHAYGQLKWESLHQYRIQAEELAQRIDRRLAELMATENARPFTDYSFLTVGGDAGVNFLRPSVLSGFPVRSDLPGLIGHFQVDADGILSSPLLPGADTDPRQWGIGEAELAARVARFELIQSTLSRNRLVPPAALAESQEEAAAALVGSTRPSLSGTADAGFADEVRLAEAVRSQAPVSQQAFDLLARRAPAETAIGELKAEREGSQPLAEASTADTGDQKAVDRDRRGQPQRKERSLLPAPAAALPKAETAAPPRLRIQAFESEIDPLELGRLDSGELVLFRRVWRDGTRMIQGLLVATDPLVEGLLETPFRQTRLSASTELKVLFGDRLLTRLAPGSRRDYLDSTTELKGVSLYRQALSAPFGELQLHFSVGRLPPGAGWVALAWISLALGLVLMLGFYLLYRGGLRQLELARQQRDFVSAVSHELKTPLTSIRMFSEILRQGWADEAKRRSYYDYIYQESERLSRLIANVLQLARLTRNEWQPDLQTVSLEQLMAPILQQLRPIADRGGFELTSDCAGVRFLIRADADSLAQILINLVDNAVKFAAKAERRQVDLRCRLAGEAVEIGVRDYGPGIPPGQMKQIFELFYRPGGELTRETMGTGIGLALARQLAESMGGAIDLINRDPGAEFVLRLPRVGVSGE